jgi:hypothetical protein
MTDTKRTIVIMEPDVTTSLRVAILYEKMDAINHANDLYWEQGEAVTLDARIEHQYRRERLEEVRKELARLRAQLGSSAES